MAAQEITSGLQKKTLTISNNFFNDIAHFDKAQINYDINLVSRVEKFFNDMSRLGKKEFHHFLTLQQFTTLNDLLSYHPADRDVMMDVLHCLIALIVGKHSESDVLGYFFLKEFREEMGRPVYSENSWKITYWFEALTYWFNLLFTKKQYQINSPIPGEPAKLIDAMSYIRKTMQEKDYIRLIKADDRFHNRLDIIFAYILGPTILPVCPDRKELECISHKTSCQFDVSSNEALGKEKETSFKSVSLNSGNSHEEPSHASTSNRHSFYQPTIRQQAAARYRCSLNELFTSETEMQEFPYEARVKR